MDYSYQQYPPKTWLVESILVTLFCCMPLGFVGIINAAKVDTLYNGGQQAEAQKASDEARKWTLIALIVGIVCHLGYVTLNLSNMATLLGGIE